MPRAKRAEKDVDRGDRFQKIRRELFPGQPRVQIGQALGGVSGGTIRNWELGQAPSPEALSILEGMGVSLDYLLYGKAPMLTPPNTEQRNEMETAGTELAVTNPKLLAKIIGANLRHIRALRFPNWGGQKKFADYLNISANDLCVYEYGRAVPNESRLNDMAARLGISADELCRPLGGVTVSEADVTDSRRDAQTVREESELLDRIEDLKREVARLEGRVELLQEQNASQEERMQKLQEANYVLRDLLYTDNSPEAKNRREQLFSRISPSISELVRQSEVF